MTTAYSVAIIIIIIFYVFCNLLARDIHRDGLGDLIRSSPKDSYSLLNFVSEQVLCLRVYDGFV